VGEKESEVSASDSMLRIDTSQRHVVTRVIIEILRVTCARNDALATVLSPARLRG